MIKIEITYWENIDHTWDARVEELPVHIINAPGQVEARYRALILSQEELQDAAYILKETIYYYHG